VKRLIHAATMSAVALAPGERPATAQPVQPRPTAEVRLAAEPTLSIGMLDGPDELLFGRINAGALLPDGSVVVSDRQNFRVQRFSAEGEHLWSRGRAGEGPGEFENVRIADGCASEESIVVYDIWSTRVSVYDGEGNLVDEYQFRYNGLPLRDFACAPGGRLGFMGSSAGMGDEGVDPGELYRELLSLGFTELGSTATTTLRERIPSSEQRLLGPGDAMPGSTWPHAVTIAVTDDGVWVGTSEDYEVELIDWTGTTVRRIRWNGPDLVVTQQDVDRYRADLEESYRDDDDPNWRSRFESTWDWHREIVPEEFPAYHRLLVGDDGVLWVHDYIRPGERSEWFAFDESGRWARTLALPPRTVLLDIGPDWALVAKRDNLDVQRVEVYRLVEGG
jgi:hypothetical protein